ncbi:MAG: hypothetical protein LBD50_02545, partial [Rickettsiales bacterium]|nr:hypothetical protein [Rickettsiales bacterium]
MYKAKTVALTNAFFKNFTGSELATLDAAKYFLKKGCRVYVFCFSKGGRLMKAAPGKLKVINILKQKIPKIKADILYGNHWAVMTKLLADKNFSANKIIHLSLSPYHEFEREPKYAKLLSKCLGNSWETAQVRRRENPGLEIQVFNNSVTPDFFKHHAKPREHLKSLAIVGNNKVFSPDGEFAKILKARGINVVFFGFGGVEKMLTPCDLLQFDAVFTIGRTVQYAMALGIPVFCYDRFGGPGYIKISNWAECEKLNYSGRTAICPAGDFESQLVKNHDVGKIADDLIGGYSEARRDLRSLRQIARERYDLFKNIESALNDLPDSLLAREDLGEEIP